MAREAAKGVSSTADRVVQHVLEHARCPHCGAAYRAEDVHVLNQIGDRIWDLATVCAECYELSMARAVVDVAAVAEATREAEERAPAFDERSEVERLRLTRLGPIAPSDVRDAAAFLDGFDGDVWAWLSRGADD